MNKLEKAAKRLRPVEPKKGYFWMVVCIIMGFVVGAYIQQYVMGPVGGLCVGVIVDEAVYKIRMKRFISKGGIPTKPESPEKKPPVTKAKGTNQVRSPNAAIAARITNITAKKPIRILY